MSQVTKSADELPHVGSAFQMNHALELFTGEQSAFALDMTGDLDLRKFIISVVKKSLSIKFEDKAFEIARAVIVEANHHQMDPLFLLAVIATESRFNIEAHGTHGEVGLMQVLPSTAKWLAPQAGLPANFDLQDPTVNIRLGATYLAHLRKTFNHKGMRYIAAYNMGVKNVFRLLASKTEPKIYPGRVLGNYAQIYMAINSVTTPVAARGLASTSVPN